MPLLCDARPAMGRSFTGFGSIQAYTGPVTHYNPATGGQSNYFAAWGGLPRRAAVVGQGTGPVAYRFCQPKVSSSAPRTEAAILYEANTVTRWFAMDFTVPDSGQDAWVASVASYTTICQWHERDQPNGGRTPPFELSVYDDAQGPRLRLVVSHDSGTGASGTSTPATVVTHELGAVTRGQRYRIVIKCKAAGAANDFLQAWLDGTQVIDYSGYCGYPNGTQNFFKIGVYAYMGTSGPAQRVMYIHAFVEGDETESLSSITAAMDATLPSLPRRTRLAVVGMGGINARGPGSTGRVHRADNGLPYADPVTPSTSAQASVWPLVADAISAAGVGCNIYNAARPGALMSSYIGRCRGTHMVGAGYGLGDSVLPVTPIGVTAMMPLGLKYVCKTNGTSAGTPPTWPTVEAQTVTDGTVTWVAERRNDYDTAGHYYAQGELGFDPLGYLSAALMSLCSVPSDRRVIVVTDMDGTPDPLAVDALHVVAETVGAEVVQVSVGSSWPTDASLATAAAAIAAAVF